MSEKYELVMPFWIDTEGYSERDRLMFCAGVEFQMVYAALKDGWRGTRSIHRENESRIRMMCGRLGLNSEVKPIPGFDEWSELTIEQRELEN